MKFKKTLVVGLAKTGLAAAKFLLKNGADVTVADINANQDAVRMAAQELNNLGATIELGPHNEQTFLNSDLIVLSPGVPHTIAPIVQAIAKGIPVIGETELASQFIHVPIVAITGTNGKTTTTELTGEMLRLSNKNVFVGGNIGTPLTELLLKQDNCDVVVLEVSSFQLDTIDTFCPNVAVILNITEDHLNRYQDMGAYAASKFKIFENQTSEHTAILNGQDTYCMNTVAAIKSNIFWLDHPSPEFQNCSVNCQSTHTVDMPFNHRFDISNTPLTGHHNRQNIAAAILASHAAGATVEGIQAALNTFKGLPHRIEFVRKINGISFYNDSKATNVDAVVKALSCFDSPVHLILGGQDKGGDYSTLIPLIQKHVCECILIGEAKTIIREGLQSQKISHIPITTERALESAIMKAYENAISGDTVLLSPACASFDMFDSYKHRGEVFKDSVGRLGIKI
ncbi:MAG: UDP-N-acetylmuramoyl-L-alanine--D-glutamate ligase [Candidatus Magnetomorum sp.]|nr:UDP-N-acetylmuramoyl-L-alanine--D-glutamate ligase [Candidatus Magnetomorum sp.]